MNSQLVLTPENIPVLSKSNAKAFHAKAKEKIFETGEGLFGYLEVVKFFVSVDKVINGDSASKQPYDSEFLEYAAGQIKQSSDKDNFTTSRGTNFALAEVATSYDFSSCNDPVLVRLEQLVKEAADNLKYRKEFLKTVKPSTGLIITDESTGETITVYPPAKSSRSSIKIKLPK